MLFYIGYDQIAMEPVGHDTRFFEHLLQVRAGRNAHEDSLMRAESLLNAMALEVFI